MSKLGFGLMRLPMADGEIDLDLVCKMVDAYMAAGGNYYDTAYGYHGGKSETTFREAVVKRYPRESFTITDKLPVFAIHEAERVPEVFAEQLERCGVEYFDYYWLHSLGGTSYPNAQKIGAFEFVAQKKAEGKIKHLGFSFHGAPEVLEQILTEHPEMEYVQLQINYLDWDHPGIRARECYEIAVRHGKDIIVMEPVKGGALANIPDEAEQLFKAREPELSTASWAIRYAGTLDHVMIVLSGMSDMEQMEDNLAVMGDFKPLDADEMALVTKAVDAIRNSIAIPCTACRYCVEGCPQKIDIPGCFSIFNEFKRFKETRRWAARMEYKDLTEKSGKASACIECGKCEDVCPQQLKIRESLKEAAGIFE